MSKIIVGALFLATATAIGGCAKHDAATTTNTNAIVNGETNIGTADDNVSAADALNAGDANGSVASNSS